MSAIRNFLAVHNLVGGKTKAEAVIAFALNRGSARQKSCHPTGSATRHLVPERWLFAKRHAAECRNSRGA
jgi:hypothetical protein